MDALVCPECGLDLEERGATEVTFQDYLADHWIEASHGSGVTL